jgi:hypothetical protein
MCRILLHLRALVDVDHILLGQPMQAEDLTQLADYIELAETHDIDPGDRMLADQRRQVLEILYLGLLEILRAVGDQVDGRLERRRVHNEGARRGSGRRAARPRLRTLLVSLHT